MDIDCFDQIVQHCGSQLLQVQLLLRLTDIFVHILRLIFLLLNLLFKYVNLFSQFRLFLFVIIGEHLEPSFSEFAVDHILINPQYPDLWNDRLGK